MRDRTARSRLVRQSVDLTAYPNLVVIFLGMRVNSLRGFKTLMSFGPKIKKSVDENPEGLLLHGISSSRSSPRMPGCGSTGAILTR